MSGEFSSAAKYDASVSAMSLGQSANGTHKSVISVHRVEPTTRDTAASAFAEAASDAGRRVLNFVLALVGIAFTAPVKLLVAILIKLTSPGPVLYMQTRVGIDRRNLDLYGGNGRRRIDYGGKLFTIYKFRTMAVNSPGADQVWAEPNDPRVTRIGRVLRNYRMDELPQLFNVLKGDMNVVGPRPEQPKIFADLRNQIDEYATRQRVLPGITGWAQVNLSYDNSVDAVRNKLRYDLEYIERKSLREDLRVMFRTFPVILFRRGSW